MLNRYIILSLFLIEAMLSSAQIKTKTLLFIGTYTDGKPGNGIYIYEFDEKLGTLKKLGEGENIVNPSYLSITPNGKYLYACTETKLPYEGSISAFKIDSNQGQIKFINMCPSGGANPVYIDIHHSNKYLVNANYTGGSVSLFEMQADGSVHSMNRVIAYEDSSIIQSRQESSHIHSANFSPNFDYVFLPDLGADKIRTLGFNFNSNEILTEQNNLDIKTNPGSGPRHFTFHPAGKFAYCLEELSGMVCVYSYSKGELKQIQSIKSYKKTQDTYGSADIHVSSDGLFLYASNRWSDENTIAIFSINKEGKLNLKGHQKTGGEHPRNFTIDPSGNYILVANMISNNIVVYRRNKKSGLLKKIGQDINVPSPSCLKMRQYKIQGN